MTDDLGLVVIGNRAHYGDFEVGLVVKAGNVNHRERDDFGLIDGHLVVKHLVKLWARLGDRRVFLRPRRIPWARHALQPTSTLKKQIVSYYYPKLCE